MRGKVSCLRKQHDGRGWHPTIDIDIILVVSGLEQKHLINSIMYCIIGNNQIMYFVLRGIGIT